MHKIGTDIFLHGGLMPTLFFTPRHREDSQLLWKAAGALGWKVERLANWRIPEHLKHCDEPVFYGEALFGPMLAEQLGLCLLNPAEDWLVRLPFEYKHRTITLTTLSAARTLKDRHFVKPPNDKSFPAGVYSGADLSVDFADDMPVLISDVVTWKSEFRCFVLNRELMTFSVYSRFGDLQRENGFSSTTEENIEVQQFVNQVLSDPRVDLPDATVIDVGYITGRGWACVEQNAAWGAGIYGCNPELVLKVIRKAATKLG